MAKDDPSRQGIEMPGVAAAENNVIGDEGKLELLQAKEDLALPFFLAEALETGFAEDLFNDAALIGQVAQLER